MTGTDWTTPCRLWIDGAGECSAVPTTQFLPGPRCADHEPAVLRTGRRAPVPDPALTLDGLRAAAGIPTTTTATAAPTVVDTKAIASGKRRSTDRDYRAARAQLDGARA